MADLSDDTGNQAQLTERPLIELGMVTGPPGPVYPVMLYSRDLIRGVSSGVNRGATGQMRALGRGAKGAVECYESVEQHRGRRCGLALGDGEALMRGSGGGIGRESYYHPCSARKRVSSCKALWRAASSCWELDGAGGGVGWAGLGA